MKKEITVAMASFPPRKAGLILTVNAILPQCDRLCLYLNGYDEVPEELPKSDKLEIVLAGPNSDAPDKGSQGKHHWLDKYPDGYYLTVDDDIFYPPDYTEKMVKAIEKYSRKAIVTCHGTSYKLDAEGHIPKGGLDRAHMLYWMYDKEFCEDIYVLGCGNGCSGYCPSELGMTCAISSGPIHSGDDGDCALFAQKNKIPIVRMATEAEWLRPNAEVWPIEAQFRNPALAKLRDAKARSWKKPWRLFPGEIAPSVPYGPAEADEPLVTVSMTTFNTPPEMLRRAVESVLLQTERRLKLIVVNDGGSRDCWAVLDDIGDPRLFRLDMPENRGTYACHAETVRRCTTKWWSPHDSDDWSTSERYSSVLRAAESDSKADVILGGYTNVKPNGARVKVMPYAEPKETVKAKNLTFVSIWAGGLWKTEWLRRAGGINGHYRCCYDSALQGLALAFSRVLTVSNAGYHYRRGRDGVSLTEAPETCFGSSYRNKAYANIDRVFDKALKAETLDEAGKILAADVPKF